MMAKSAQEILLQAATDLFYMKGYADTSIRDIGARAHMSTSLVYHYFKDKEEMLFQIADVVSREFLEGLQEINARVADPLEALEEMLTLHVVRYGLKRKKESKIVTEDSQMLRGKRREVIRARQRAIFALYLSRLQELADRGKLRDVDLTVVCFSLIGAITWSHRWFREGGRLSKADVARNILTLIFHGCLDPEALATARGGTP